MAKSEVRFSSQSTAKKQEIFAEIYPSNIWRISRLTVTIKLSSFRASQKLGRRRFCVLASILHRTDN